MILDSHAQTVYFPYLGVSKRLLKLGQLAIQPGNYLHLCGHLFALGSNMRPSHFLLELVDLVLDLACFVSLGPLGMGLFVFLPEVRNSSIFDGKSLDRVVDVVQALIVFGGELEKLGS